MPQLKNKYSVHFIFSILVVFFSFEIKVYTINNAKNLEAIVIISSTTYLDNNIKEMTIITIESIHSMFEKLISLIRSLKRCSAKSQSITTLF